MAGIVAVTRFCESTSSKFSNYINYIDRNEAVRKDNINTFSMFEEYTEYMDDDTKTILEEQRTTNRISSLFTKETDKLSRAEKEQLKQVYRQAQKNGSNMWQTVISFDNDYLEQVGILDKQTNSINEKLLRSAARKSIQAMLHNENLDNAVWSAAIHYNTDNIHIHIATVEPIPMREKKQYVRYEKTSDGHQSKTPITDKHGNPVLYEAYKGTFKPRSIDTLKSTLRSELEDNKETYSKITNLLRENILADKQAKNLLNVPLFEEKMKILYQDLVESHIQTNRWAYNMTIMQSYRESLDELSTLFIEAYHKDDFREFVDMLKTEESRQEKAYGGKIHYLENALYGKEGLYARLGNAILKELRSFDKSNKANKAATQNAMKMLDKNGSDYAPAKGIKILKDLSMQGNTYAMNQMGLLSLKGDVVKRDIAEAAKYFSQSAAKGDGFAKSMLIKLKQSADQPYRPKATYKSYPSRDIRRGFRALQRSMRDTYQTWKNKLEAEELQESIARRGEEYKE